jgi:Holliday junction DNA helicase RuvA
MAHSSSGRGIVISYLNGILKRKLPDRVILDVGGVGYEVFLPQFVMRSMQDTPEGEAVELDIYYHVSERQLRPTLIGFNNSYEKRFFEKFISVEDIGPQKASRAMTVSVSTLARAIEAGDADLLRRLPGIGDRTANKVVATLRGKVTEEALLRDQGFTSAPPEPAAVDGSATELRADGIEMLVSLGHSRAEARDKVDAALKRNPAIASPQELITEVYRGEQEKG